MQRMEAPLRGPDDNGVVGPPPVSPPSFVLRRMREIDPRLGLEWRPLGVAWGQPREQPRGCWRIVLRSPSGRVRGLRLWPPHACDGRLVEYLDSQVLPRLRGRRDHYAENLSPDALEQKATAEEAEKRRALLKGTDHAEMWYTLRREHAEKTEAGFSNRMNWSLGAVTDRRACSQESA